jgi:tetratricopeptide (TPR) repeat protein
VNWLLKVILQSFFLVCLSACQSLNTSQPKVAEAVLFFKSNAMQSFKNEQFQEAQTMAEAWVALEPSQEAKTLLDTIEQRRQILFDKARNCKNQTKNISRRHHCIKKQLRYKPGYKAAIDELRTDKTAEEMALLEDAHDILEEMSRIKSTTAQIAVKTPPKDTVEPVISNPVQDEIDRSLMAANMDRIHKLIAKDEWVTAGKLLLVIKNEWEGKQTDLKPLRQSVAENLYLEGKKLFRGSVDKAIGMWELAVAIDRTHSLAKLTLKRAYKIQKNLNSIN